MKNEKQKKILKFLKKEGRCAAYKISSYISLPINYTKKYLEELLKENKVVKEKETNATYWSIK